MARKNRGKSLDDISKQNRRLVDGLNIQLRQAYRSGDYERAEEIKGRITKVQRTTYNYESRINNQKTIKKWNDAFERASPNETAYYDAIKKVVQNRSKKYSQRTYMGASVG